MQQEMSKVQRYEEMINSTLDSNIKDFQELQEKFVERVMQDPANAIQWNSEPLVIAQTKANLVHMIRNAEDQTDLLRALKFAMNRIERDLINNYGGSSTNSYSNANDKAEAEGKSRFYREMEYYVEAYESAINAEKEQEELAENVTDTTVYALRANYCSLLNQLQKAFVEQDAAKTQRDKKAAFKAVSTINNSIQNLSKLAEDLSINLTNTEN